MPEKETLERAHRDAEEGKSPSTQAGEFVRGEMDHIREGKHGAASTKQAIAIGLSKGRHAGVDLPPPGGRTSARTREQAARDTARGERGGAEKASKTRSRATSNALKHEGHSAASHASLSRQAKSVAKQRGPQARKASAQRAARTRKSTAVGRRKS